MADVDVILRAKEWIGYGGVCSWQPGRKDTYKKAFILTIAGSQAIGLMMTLYPLLGARRRSAIRAVIAQWRTVPANPRRVHNNLARMRGVA